MKVGVLSSGKSLYSTQRLVEAATQRGHEVHLIDYPLCYLNINSKKPSIHYQGHLIETMDAIIPRIAPKRSFYGTAVVRQFEAMGTYSINSSTAIARSRDKLRTLQLLARKGVDMPITSFANSPSDINDLIKIVGGSPTVIKIIEGTQGVGVVLAETNKASASVIQAFMGLNENIIVQEFIQESQGSDIRCIVLGDKVVASMKRQAEEGEFRSNVHQGGSVTPVKITKEERIAAVKAANVMRLNFAGVDLLRSNRGPLIMEVNSSPGLEGIETATGKDIASMVIAFIEKKAKPIGPKSHYFG